MRQLLKLFLLDIFDIERSRSRLQAETAVSQRREEILMFIDREILRIDMTVISNSQNQSTRTIIDKLLNLLVQIFNDPSDSFILIAKLVERLIRVSPVSISEIIIVNHL